MPPSRTARSSRSKEIPGDFIVSWRSTDARGGQARPLVRRPITACKNCRTAKVKCNGQQGCHRCTTRGLACSYGSAPDTERGSTTADRRSATALSPLTGISDAIGREKATVTIAPSDLDNGAEFWVGDGQNRTPVSQAGHLNSSSLDDMAWTQFNTNLKQQQSRQARQRSCPEFLGNPPFSGHSDQSHDTTESTPTPRSAVTDDCQSEPSAGCQCRAKLMLCLPKVSSALEDRQLDRVFKATSEIFQCSQQIMDCKAYEARCSDLLHIMTALQETHPCFDRIAKSDLEDTVKMGFGRYEVASRDANLRGMLVMNLVQRASAVLDAISSKGQSMIEALGEPSSLARANIAYLEATIGHFRPVFSCVARYVE